MRLLILTSSRHGTASRCLPALCRNARLSVVGIVLAQKASVNRARLVKRKLDKILRVGVLGALNGIRLWGWYRDNDADDLVALARQYNVPYWETQFLNSEETRRLFSEAKADLGLSLGNGYIAEGVFSIPKYGMINIHGEILPDFQGAQSVIWPIFEGTAETGFSIHQIDRHIDTGNILFQKRYPILFCPTLSETVEKTSRIVRADVPEALASVCENYEQLRKQAAAPVGGRSYTTPSIFQFWRMVRNHKAMYRRALALKTTAQAQQSKT